MNEIKEATGTTLEILAPYLPYGIEVETGMGVSRIVSVDFMREGPEVETCTADDWANGEINGTDFYHFSQVLPILRPFEALVHPLPDGTVPLIELAKLAYSKRRNLEWEWVQVRADGDYGFVLYVDHKAPEINFRKLTISETRAITGVDSPCTLPLYNYLRSKHFAVGLEPHQFIPKI